METLLNIIGGWLFIGICSFILLVVADLVGGWLRGPEYQMWMMEQIRRRGHSVMTLRTAIVLVVTWPVVLGVVIASGWRKMTVSEWIVEQEERMEQRKEQRKAKKSRPILHSAWFPVGTPPVFARLQRGADGSLVMTHFIGSIQGRYIGSRVASTDKALAPLVSGSDLEAVKKVCNDDREWSEMCLPGREQEREQEFQRLRDNPQRVVEL